MKCRKFKQETMSFTVRTSRISNIPFCRKVIEGGPVENCHF